MIRNLLQPFYTLWVVVTFLFSLLTAFPLFFIIGLWDKAWARRLIWNVVHYWSIGWLFCIGMPMYRSGNQPDDKKYIFVANHISYMDTVLIYAAVPHYFRTLGKKEMVKVPVFGFVYKQLAILVDRSSEHSRAKSMKLMWRLLKNECNIAIFPEGTFNETCNPLKEFYNGAFRLAIKTQTPIYPMIFPDTVNRWHYNTNWKLKPGKNRVEYLEPISPEGYTMDNLSEYKALVFSRMEEAMKAYM